MRVGEITLQPFRNLPSLHLVFDAGGVLIVGDNGSGKSNILEAISYLSIGKSIRGARDSEAVPHEGRHFDISATWHDGSRERQLRLFYGLEEGKRVFLDEAPLPKVSDVLSLFQTVHFSPEDVALVLRFGAQRRRLLDILISQSSAPYLHDLQRYQRILSQRNQCLRNRSSGADGLAAWDAQLCRVGAAIRRVRLHSLIEFVPRFSCFYRRFSTGREVAGVTYQGQVINGPDIHCELPGEDAMVDQLAAELAQQADRERHVGHTVCGPHRDALDFTLDGESADTFGSQGQLKSILVAWKMAELRFLESCSGQQPVLLLDDVFSELDEIRSGELIDLVGDFEQVLLTAPRMPDERLRQGFAEVRLN